MDKRVTEMGENEGYDDGSPKLNDVRDLNDISEKENCSEENSLNILGVLSNENQDLITLADLGINVTPQHVDPLNGDSNTSSDESNVPKIMSPSAVMRQILTNSNDDATPSGAAQNIQTQVQNSVKVINDGNNTSDSDDNNIPLARRLLKNRKRRIQRKKQRKLKKQKNNLEVIAVNYGISSSEADTGDFSPTDGSDYVPSDKSSSTVTLLSFSEAEDPQDPDSRHSPVSPSLLEPAVNNGQIPDSPLPGFPNAGSTSDDDVTLNCNQGRPSRGRKRKCPQNREDRKNARNANKEYYDYKLRRKSPKRFKDYKCKCIKACVAPLDVRHRFFKKFWELANYDAQTAYIGTFVKETPNEKQTKKKKFLRTYYIESFKVCRDMFCNTLNVCSTRVSTAMEKLHSRRPLTDQRGKKQGGTNRMTDLNVKEIKDFIATIPLYTSHYRRENTTGAKFFKPGVTLSMVYEQYKLKLGDNAVSFSTFKSFFYSNYNIKVKVLSKDTCNVCDKLHVEAKNAARRGQNVEGIKSKHEEHLKRAKIARDQMKADMALAKEQEDTECLTYDMEKTLPLPRLQTNIIFYKRQLWFYNSGVHSAKKDQSFCYPWVEGQAGRGAQEVGSCLLKHIINKVGNDVKHLILWSDSCGGQNRNIKITLLMKVALKIKTNLEDITFKYLIPGHSYLPNDKDFGDIERALRFNQRVYTPDEYVEIMKLSKKTKPIQVDRMETEGFFSTADLEKKIINRKKSKNGEKINWLDTRQIKITKAETYDIYMKSDFDNEHFVCLDIKRKISKRQRVDGDDSDFEECLNNPLPLLWPNGKPIPEPKLQDLKSLMHLIPADAHQFYNNLTGAHVEDDVDGFNGDIDFEFNVED